MYKPLGKAGLGVSYIVPDEYGISFAAEAQGLKEAYANDTNNSFFSFSHIDIWERLSEYEKEGCIRNDFQCNNR
ncbi:MAG: hypothetical protein M0R40_00350 [Firmicutes bacterium]|nr:hypothetical protein [Bacillota bacterium]